MCVAEPNCNGACSHEAATVQNSYLNWRSFKFYVIISLKLILFTLRILWTGLLSQLGWLQIYWYVLLYITGLYILFLLVRLPIYVKTIVNFKVEI